MARGSIAVGRGGVEPYVPPVLDGNFELDDEDFNLSPRPRPGQGAYGLVPGAQGLPDPFGDLSKRFPGLEQSNAQLSQNIMSELQGELPQDVIDAIQDDAARFGLTSGMPGSDLARRRGARNLGLTSLGLQQRGLQDYLGATTGIKNTQTVDPGLQANIAAYNAVLNSAPDPAQAAAQMRRDFASGAGAGGGTGLNIRTGMPNLTTGGPSNFPAPDFRNPFFHGQTGSPTGGGSLPYNPWSGNAPVNQYIPQDLWSGASMYGGGGVGDQGPQDPFWDQFWTDWDNSFGSGVGDQGAQDYYDFGGQSIDDIFASLGA